MEQTVQNPKDKWIPRYFFIFFAVIFVLDGIFVYLAVSTQTGVVTKQPYEKGLAYNETLKKAKAQPVIENSVTFENGILRWVIPVSNATVTGFVIRPVQAGYDFNITLEQVEEGVYEARPNMPLPGHWIVKLSARWNNQQYQTSYKLIAP